MAITLITGVPGSGKTLYAVWYAQQQLKAGRRLVVDGIRDLALEHELVDETWVRQWFDNAKHQDLIIIDEAQRIWPPTSVSVKPTPDIEKLHVHRHLGVDFILITQHPQRINKTIRDLVGRHVHVRRLFGMRRAMLYEWDHCHNVGSLRDSVKTQWAYPRKVFELYTSAEVHTKQKAVVPKALFVLPVALILGVVLAWKGFKSVTGGFGGPVKASPLSPSPLGAPAAGVAAPSSPSDVDSSKIWRVAGRYAMDGRGFIVLADATGRLRIEESTGFKGMGDQVQGTLAGATVTAWSGQLPNKAGSVGGQ